MLKKKNYDITRDGLRDWLSENPDSTPSESEAAGAEEALLAFASAHQLPPPPERRSKVLEHIARLNRQKKERRPFQANHWPFLEENPNWLDWNEAVAGIEPPEDFENIHLHTLESNDQRDLFVVWVKEFVEEEIHHDLLESFLILEGDCECHITDPQGDTRIVRLSQGDWITMKLGETHDIVITSAVPAKAILQWKKLAVA